MGKYDNQKLKILYILDYLQKNSHESKPVRAAELIAMLQNRHGISGRIFRRARNTGRNQIN